MILQVIWNNEQVIIAQTFWAKSKKKNRNWYKLSLAGITVSGIKIGVGPLAKSE